jgi:hypothetical protein
LTVAPSLISGGFGGADGAAGGCCADATVVRMVTNTSRRIPIMAGSAYVVFMSTA